MVRDIYQDFDTFSRALVGSKDVDPVYIIIPKIVDYYGFDPIWFTFCYTSFYSLESGIKLCQEMPDHTKWNKKRFIELRNTELKKFGTERRGTNRAADNMVNAFNGVINCIENELFDWSSNSTFRKSLMKNVPFQGVWASFKNAEIFEKAFGFDVVGVTDLGINGKDPKSDDGPLATLNNLFGLEEENRSEFWYPTFEKLGVKLAKKWGMNIGEVETCFCKFNKIRNGKYFIGHDIQEFLELKHVLGGNFYTKMMSTSFDDIFWKDVDHFEKHKKAHFKSTGEFLYENYKEYYPEVDVQKTILEIL